MKTINTLLLEVAKEIEQTEIENIEPKSKEWLEKRDNCLVEILKVINDEKNNQ